MGKGQSRQRDPLLTARRQPATKRLADRLLAIDQLRPAPWTLPSGGPSRQYRAPATERAVRSALSSVPVIAADNVADYLFSLPAGSGVRFPNLAPPFASFWIEARIPARANLDYPRSVGALFSAIELPGYAGFADAKDEAAWNALTAEERALKLMPDWEGGLTTDAGFRGQILAGLGQSRWLLHLQTFYELTDEDIVGPVVKTLLFVADDGSLRKIVYSPAAMYNRSKAPDHEGMLFHLRLQYPLFLAISLMHCKNVTVNAAPATPALSKAHQKKTGRPLLLYRTLSIAPMTTVLSGQGSAGTKGLGHALHICHGHFKDYTARGLFGKLRGTYWWPEHVRGSAEIGRVAKTYSVSA